MAPANRSNPVLALEERFWRLFSFLLDPNKNKFISMKPNSNLNHFQQLFIPPPLYQYNLFWSYQKQVRKQLLGRQNCVSSTGGRHNLVPGLTMERRRIKTSEVILPPPHLPPAPGITPPSQENFSIRNPLRLL